MANLVFPDTTVLCNFAAVDRIDLLTDWLRDRGRWCEAVWAETRKSAGHWPRLNPLLKVGGPLGAPIEINDPSVIHRVDRVRVSVFGGAPDDPLKHLGEAQTCVLLAEHGEFYGSWWITEDNDAYEYAVRRRITTLRMRRSAQFGRCDVPSEEARLRARGDPPH